MSLSIIKNEVSLMLAEVNRKLGEAEAKLAAGSDQEKVAAAGEVAFLKDQHRTIKARLAQIDSHPEASESLFQWFKEELFNLGVRLDEWVARH